MLAQLEAAGVPVTPIRQNPAKVQHVGPALEALCSKSAELKVRFAQAVQPLRRTDSCRGADISNMVPRNRALLRPSSTVRCINQCARHMPGCCSHGMVHILLGFGMITVRFRGLACGPQELSQRALVSYLRSVFLQPNRAVFDVSALPVSNLVKHSMIDQLE